MKIYQYKDYNEYVASQIEANIRKIKNIWVEKKTIQEIAQQHGPASTILCHGTRNAAEQKYFKDFYPNADVLGTEISPTANDFPMTVQWDFNQVNKEWVGKYDIVYSNAFDHSCNPKQTLSVWKQQLTPDGKLYLEHGYSDVDNEARASDPLEIYEEELNELFAELGLEIINTFESTGVKGVCPCKIYILTAK
jgi:hypothetical protein